MLPNMFLAAEQRNIEKIWRFFSLLTSGEIVAILEISWLGDFDDCRDVACNVSMEYEYNPKFHSIQNRNPQNWLLQTTPMVQGRIQQLGFSLKNASMH